MEEKGPRHVWVEWGLLCSEVESVEGGNRWGTERKIMGCFDHSPCA